MSRRIFAEHVWPLWSSEVASLRLISTEGSERVFESEADRSGTDGFFVRRTTGILCPIASRVEFLDPHTNNPFAQFWKHYPRFTIRLAKTRPDGTLTKNVECQKRLKALNDPISRRYLPLYTFQSLVRWQSGKLEIIQSAKVSTEELFEFVKQNDLDDLDVGKPSWTRDGKDAYRIVTVEKLRASGVKVDTLDFRVR